MIQLTLNAFEKLINTYLRLDPESANRLAKLHNKVISIEVLDWSFTFNVIFVTQGIQLVANYAGKPDASIAGNLLPLVKVLYNKGDSASLFQNNINIIDHGHIMQDVQLLIKNVDIDWEEHFAKILGDSVAHKLFYHANQTISLGKEILKNLQESFTEYVQHEKNVLPPQIAVEEFFLEVGKLRDDVDRLEAKIRYLQKIKLQGNHDQSGSNN